MMRPLALFSRTAAYILPALLLLSGTATALAKETPQPAIAAPAAQSAKPGLWVLKDEDTTIYLFGTVHFLKPDTNWQNSRISQAFTSADTLMLEIPPVENQADMAKIILPLAMTKGTPPLSERLSREDRAAYHAALAQFSMPPSAFDSFKPWFAATTLSLMPAIKAGYNPAQGVEHILSAQAKAQNKKITALETVEQQLGFFDQLSPALQIAYLNESVKSLNEATAMLDQMVSLWLLGQTDELATVMNEALATSPELGALLLDKRNQNWAEQLQKQLAQPGTVFVAVGSGHLAGDASVQHYLARRGLTVERISY